jgi:hypothetical protein
MRRAVRPVRVAAIESLDLGRIATSTPNLSAWLKARAVRASPEMPVGKPR